MSEICLTCSTPYNASINSSGGIRAKATVLYNGATKFANIGSVKSFNSTTTPVSSRVTGQNSVKAKTIVALSAFGLSDAGVGSIKSKTVVSNNIKTKVPTLSKLTVKKVDKFSCSVSNKEVIDKFSSTEKLYPIADIVTNYNNSYLVDRLINSGNLYSSIDEGVFTGSYTKHNGISNLITDEKQTYIQPSSVFTKGDFRYRCEVTPPISDARQSFLVIRASAPVSDYASDIPPVYKIHNIRLEDPSGNLIIKYKDITVRGDADYKTDYVNFATYISEPEINNLSLKVWESGYPIIGSTSGYTLNLDFNIDCLDDPFSEGFSKGYEDTCKLDYVIGTSGTTNDYLGFDGSPLSTQTQGYSLNPNNSIRISAIEICNSGGVGVLRGNYLTFYSAVDNIGQRLSREIFPSEVLTYDNDLNIYPLASSIWRSSLSLGNEFNYNTTKVGSQSLLSRLQDSLPFNYITLVSTSPVSDSGRLSLKFSHKPPTSVASYAQGAFSFGGETDAFDSAELQRISEVDSFFVIDSVELKVVAKKESGSPNYCIDVVGYSDDKILNISPKINAFLQNAPSTNAVSGNYLPHVSGFGIIDDLGIATDSFSNKSQYFDHPLINKVGGDHYALSTIPVVTGTTFQEYTIPLKIELDNVDVGQSPDYSISSYFENLYVDLYPIPSGASISTAYLVVTYKPSNGLMLHTIGQQTGSELAKRSITLYPSSRNESDDISDTGPSYNPISLITDIPQAYKNTSTLKTNYARRWRGVNGEVVSGPYNHNQFSLDFLNPPLSKPFLNGYYSFNNDLGNFIISDELNNLTTSTGTYVGNYNKLTNIGLRFNSNSLFGTDYQSIDWTEEGHELYGKIADAFDNAVRVSGHLGYINFSNMNMSSGLSVFVRFSPDINMSGVGYNLWNSGVIASKFDSDKELEFMIYYENGTLKSKARKSNGEYVVIEDSIQYDEYQYPLSILLTYNDANSQKLKLYADNENSSYYPWARLRAESPAFTLYNDNSDLTFGYSEGSGVGINAFITDIGISTFNTSGTNILSSGNIDKTLKQIYADEFFDGFHQKFWNSGESYTEDTNKLWSYIDQDNSEWSLGDYNVCSFSADFFKLTDRSGQDFLVHNLTHDGSGYSTRTNIILPSNIIHSELAYHSQIENDFVRFYLSDIPNINSFYSAYPRISKTIPRGYDFEERSIAIDTIVEHDTFNTINWTDGKVGPKLIVSLYTRTKDPLNRPDKINWGLVNRSSHYLKPSGCFQKLKSTFNYNDYVDQSEPWSVFDSETSRSELNHKYFSNDIDDMFLQYDLAYPSGSSFSSSIKIHSANVRLENALIKATDLDNNLNLSVSGDKMVGKIMNLTTFGLEFSNNSINFYGLTEPPPIADSSLNIHCSGAVLAYNTLRMYSHNIGVINDNLPIYVGGRSDKYGDGILPLLSYNTMSMPASSGSMVLFVNNRVLEPSSGKVNLFSVSALPPVNRVPFERVNLFINGEPVPIASTGSFSLFIDGKSIVSDINSSVNLHLRSYPTYNREFTKDIVIDWNGKS